MRGVSMQDFADTLQIYEGSLYVNDFNRFGRTWQVIVQAEAELPPTPRRSFAADDPQRSRWPWCRWARWLTCAKSTGRLVLTRYNMYTAASINGFAAPGISSGEAIALMQRLAETGAAEGHVL